LIKQIKSLGMTQTAFSDNAKTSVGDLANFLAKLEQGDSLRPDEKGKLLTLMRRQVYRQGIPAGVGVPVADKVGFMDGYLHDAAIVYAPSGTYILVIMTSGSSWGEIAQVSKQIQAFVSK
jgi:beta-lactamase class A